MNVSRIKNQILGTGYITGLKTLTSLISIPKPTVLTGKGSSLRMTQSMAQFGLNKVLVVTDAVLHELGVLDGILAELDKQGMAYSLFTEVLPDPTFDVVEAGLKQFRQDNCDCVLAVGGGSSIDAAKVVALAATNNTEPKRLIGVLKGRKPSAPFFVVPTTAGTGSEATIGAVISDSETHQKGLVIDTKIVPMLASLDPELMKGLPKAITAATGVDALTHLVEAYMSGMATEESDFYARSGIQMIFENLNAACKRGNNMQAREKLALASYYGGLTINSAGLGYVHAFAHQLGALYRIPHGVANAKVLPQVLEFNREVCEARLADLARVVGLGEAGDSQAKLAGLFVTAVKDLIASVGIEAGVAELNASDYEAIISAAFKEANSTYAVPKYMGTDDAVALLDALAA